jgi:hypothetical protein
MFNADAPAMLGAVLELVAATLANWGAARDHVTLDVRMPHFARIGEALGIELGWEPGSFTVAYRENRVSAAREIAQEDPLFAPLMVVATGGWSGTLGELLTGLNAAAPPMERGKTWPSSPRALGNALRRLSSPLAEAGLSLAGPRDSNGSNIYDLMVTG